VRANPKVDPWLPGEGREIVVPSQFILPDAPRTGLVINIAPCGFSIIPRSRRGERPVVLTHPIGIGKGGLAHSGGRHEDRSPPAGSHLARAGLGAQGAS